MNSKIVSLCKLWYNKKHSICYNNLKGGNSMNFQEELSTAIKEKAVVKDHIKEKTDYILDLLLKHLKGKKYIDFLSGIRIKFKLGGITLCIEECYNQINTSKVKEIIDIEIFGSSDDAHIVLLLLEKKFKDEGYDLLLGESDGLNDEFTVIIKA